MELTNFGNVRNGVLLVDMNYSGIEQMFERVNDGGVGFVYLCDSEGEIIYHPMQKAIFAGLLKENNLVHAGHADGAFSEKFDGQERDVVVKTVGYTGWKIISVTPISELAVDMGQMRNYLLMVAIIILILIVFGNYIISYVVTDPIRKLEESIAYLEEGVVN